MASDTKQLKVVLSANAKQLQSTLKQVQKNFKVFKRNTAKLSNELKKLGAISLAPLAGGLAAVAAMAKGAIAKTMEYGGSVDDVSRSLGVATDALQSFRFAAKLGGSSAEEMDGALAKLNVNLANAVEGKNKDVAALFKHLGISMKDANGQMRTADQLMPEIADAIARQTDQTAKAYIATTLFGKSGQNLIKTLSGGSKELEAIRKEAEALGLIQTEEQIANAAKFGDTMTTVKEAITGLQLTIGNELIPVMQPILESFIEWIKVNRQWIASSITDAVKYFSESLQQLPLRSIVEGTLKFVKACVQLFNEMGGLKTVAIAIGAIFAGKLLSSVVSTALALKSFISIGLTLAKSVLPLIITGAKTLFTLLAANPIGLVITAIGLLVAGGIALYKNWDTVKEKLKAFWDMLVEVKDYVCDVFSSAWETSLNKISSIFSSVFNGLVEIAKAPINAIIGLLNKAIGALNTLSFSVPDWIPGIGGKEFSLNIPEIPQLATGGIATKPTMAMIGEGTEPEAVLPLSKLGDMLNTSRQQSEIVVRVIADKGTTATVERSRLAPATRLVLDTGLTR